MRATPIQPTDLQQLSKQDSHSFALLTQWLAPIGGDVAQPLSQAAHTLSQQQDAHLSWAFQSVRNYPNLEALAPGPAFALRAWHGDTELLLLLDLHLALVWLDLHFARFTEGPRSARPLSPLEEGLMTTILARICATISEQGGPSLHLDTLPARPQAIAQRLADQGQGLLCIEAQLTVHRTTGALRILTPSQQTHARLQPAPQNAQALRLW